MKQIWKCSLIIAFLVMGDQLLKGTLQSFYQVNNFEEIFSGLWFGYAKNHGYLFGLGETWPEWLKWPLTYLLPIVIFLYFSYQVILYRFARFSRLLSYSFILTGVLGNYLDRLMYGHVVDFIAIGSKTSMTPSFNTADLFIIFGIFIYMFLRFTSGLEDEANPLTIQ